MLRLALLAALVLLCATLIAQTATTAQAPAKPVPPSGSSDKASSAPEYSLPSLPTLAAPEPKGQTATNPGTPPQAPAEKADGPVGAVNNDSPSPTGTLPESESKPHSTEEAGSISGFSTRTPRYLLRPGDVVDITFTFAPEFNQTLPVQPDGFVALRGVGDLHVAGLNITQLREELVKKYSAMLHDPKIDVTLKEFEKPFFIANGQVIRPGKYEMRGDTTVTEALAIAGGFNDRAKHSQVLLFHRISADWVQARTVNVKAILAGKQQEDLRVQPGDMIFVPQNKMSKIKPYLPTASMGAYMNPTQF